MRTHCFKHIVGTLAALSVTIGLAIPAAAAGFGIQPVRQDLSPEASVGQFTLTSEDDKITTFTVTGLSWKQVNGKDNLAPTQDLLIVPPVFQLFPFQKKLFRVTVRTGVKPADVEQTYRIYVTEQVSKVDVTGPTVKIARRFSLPIFIAPLKPSDALPTFRVLGSGKKVRFSVTNSSNVHTMIAKIKIYDGAKTFYSGPANGYVLAGQTRSWPIELSAGLSGRSVLVDYTDDSGVRHATASIVP